MPPEAPVTSAVIFASLILKSHATRGVWRLYGRAGGGRGRGRGSGADRRAAAERAFEEGGDAPVGRDAVRELADAVPLVGPAQVVDLAAALAYGADELVGLCDGVARVVRPVRDEERRLDVGDVRDGADLFEELAVGRV